MSPIWIRTQWIDGWREMRDFVHGGASNRCVRRFAALGEPSVKHLFAELKEPRLKASAMPIRSGLYPATEGHGSDVACPPDLRAQDARSGRRPFDEVDRHPVGIGKAEVRTRASISPSGICSNP